MAAGGDGPWAMAVLWSLTGVVFVFLLLRIYTRLYCISSYGVDDYLYAISFVVLVVYCAVVQAAVEYGFGQDTTKLNAKEIKMLSLYRTCGQTIAMVETPIAKACVGFFLLRLVVSRWQRVFVWASVSIFSFIAGATAIVSWVGCTPMASGWDDTIAGTCVNSRPLTILFALGTIILDICFVILPWVFIWDLQMPRREKIRLTCCLSLSIFAAIAGIQRVVVIRGTQDVAVEVFVWSTVELAATLVCVGIPAGMPIFLKLWLKFKRWRGASASGVIVGQDSGAGPEVPLALETIGGGEMAGVNSPGRKGGRRPSLFSQVMASISREEEGASKDGASDRRLFGY